jgi:hypothetical protein
MHNKTLTNLIKEEKKSKTFIIFFDVSQQGLSSISLQSAPASAIVFWQSQSYLSFGA